ncbi:hypothetical protein [Actinacidiphila acididurans]|uniref:Secreted protein n=1 Tax=Actinacidiphila acididurans TaxID=2784346 RepID=A0ABS2TPU6_9ACTN|nr:hypothetical protein [Actinacidiphila acididurans]MBM9504536.1 hypothetical protein [Actinacidiphila acididurans]
MTPSGPVLAMSQNAATVWAAAAGGIAAIIAGVIAYAAGRRTVRDQEDAQRRHWLLEQRQDAYAKFVVSMNAFQAAIEEAQDNWGAPDGHQRMELLGTPSLEMDYALARVRMLGPESMAAKGADVESRIYTLLEALASGFVSAATDSNLRAYRLAKDAFLDSFENFVSEAGRVLQI